MNEQQPIINPQMNDDYNNGKGSKTIKVAIFLTILLIGAIIAMGISVKSMLGKADSVNKESETTEAVINTTKEVSNDFTVNTLELDDFILFSIVNTNAKTMDLNLRVNTYVGEELDDTKSYSLTAIESGMTGYIKVYKTDLGIYDTYDYTVNGSDSYFTSVAGSNIEITRDNNVSGVVFELNNTSGVKLQKASVVCLFYKNNIIVDAKIKEVYEEEERELIEFTDSTKEYNNVIAYINEAYYLK